MKIVMTFEFASLDEAIDAVSKLGSKTAAAKGKKEAVSKPVVETVLEPVQAPVPTAEEITAHVLEEAPAVAVDDFTAPPAPKQELQFTVPTLVTDMQLLGACQKRMEDATAAGRADEVRAQITVLVGQFGRAGVGTAGIPQEKRAEFIKAVAAIR